MTRDLLSLSERMAAAAAHRRHLLDLFADAAIDLAWDLPPGEGNLALETWELTQDGPVLVFRLEVLK